MLRRKLALIALVLVSALVGGEGVAHACSCVPIDVASRLASGQPAVIGEVIAKSDGVPIGSPPYDEKYVYTVRVERSFNWVPTGEIAIHGRSNGGICGFSWSVGQRVGAFVMADGDEWTTGSCSLVQPAKLEAAAEPPIAPPPIDPPAPPVDPGRGPALRARLGDAVVAAAARNAATLQRLPVRPGARVRLRLLSGARGVRVGLAGANGKRISAMRSAVAIGDDGLVWRATLPLELPARADRMIVSIDHGARRVKLAVGITTRSRAAAAAPCPAQPDQPAT